MISPLRNLTFKGALWYQGESNAGRPGEYGALLTAMLKDWRVKFADEDLPLYNAATQFYADASAACRKWLGRYA